MQQILKKVFGFRTISFRVYNSIKIVTFILLISVSNLLSPIRYSMIGSSLPDSLVLPRRTLDQFEIAHSFLYVMYELFHPTIFSDSIENYTLTDPYKGPVKLIQQVKIAHSFLYAMSKLFHPIIFSGSIENYTLTDPYKRTCEANPASGNSSFISICNV